MKSIGLLIYFIAFLIFLFAKAKENFKKVLFLMSRYILFVNLLNFRLSKLQPSWRFTNALIGCPEISRSLSVDLCYTHPL